VITDTVVLDGKKLKGEAGTFYRTEVGFTDKDGGEVHGRMRLTRQYRTDDRISVVYDPANPKRADLTLANRPNNPGAGPLAVGKLGWALVLLLFIPGVVLVLGKWGNPI
jgi:hypothetical protein